MGSPPRLRHVNGSYVASSVALRSTARKRSVPMPIRLYSGSTPSMQVTNAQSGKGLKYISEQAMHLSCLVSGSVALMITAAVMTSRCSVVSSGWESYIWTRGWRRKSTTDCFHESSVSPEGTHRYASGCVPSINAGRFISRVVFMIVCRWGSRWLLILFFFSGQACRVIPS